MIHQRTALITALATVLVGACTTPPPCPPAVEHYQHPVFSIPAETDANIALAESYLMAVISADADAIRASVAPGFYSNNTFVPADSSDVEEVIANWMRIDSTRTDQKIIKDYAQSIEVAEGNDYHGQWVQYWGKYSATDNATGKPFQVKFIFDCNVKDGKLVKSYMWFDRLSSFHQLGIAPPAAPAAK
jgi:ketosteroid isomerase-like protein